MVNSIVLVTQFFVILNVFFNWDKSGILFSFRGRIHSLPNTKILDWSKLTFADDTIHVTQKLKFALGGIENIVGKGENAGHQHFLFSQNVFKRLLCQGR